jgi:hypothetical protein
MTRHLASVAGIVAIAVCSNAQAIESITYTIEWANGLVPVGGSNTGAVYATITPSIGSMTQWNTPPGNGESGILKAFASSIINLVNTKGSDIDAVLTWTVPAEFNLANIPGTSDGNNGILGSQSGQFGPPANSSPNTSQKVKVLDLKWTLLSAMTIEPVEYTTQALSSKVFLDVGLAAWVGENAAKIDTAGGFSALPSPAALPALLVMGLAVRWRRR